MFGLKKCPQKKLGFRNADLFFNTTFEIDIEFQSLIYKTEERKMN